MAVEAAVATEAMTDQPRPPTKGAVAVGLGNMDGEEMVLLQLYSDSGAVVLSPETARFVALQLIQWANHLTPKTKPEEQPA